MGPQNNGEMGVFAVAKKSTAIYVAIVLFCDINFITEKKKKKRQAWLSPAACLGLKETDYMNTDKPSRRNSPAGYPS